MIGIKDFNKKITSLQSMRKMTKTMKMVSASKFKGAHKAQISAEVYAHKLSELMERLSSCGPTGHPLLKTKEVVARGLIVLFTSDKGLCGGFNNNLIRETRHWIAENLNKHITIDMSFCGRRGYMSFRRTARINKHYQNITLKPAFEDALALAKDITDSFIKPFLLARNINRTIAAIMTAITIKRIFRQGETALALKSFEKTISPFSTSSSFR